MAAILQQQEQLTTEVTILRQSLESQQSNRDSALVRAMDNSVSTGALREKVEKNAEEVTDTENLPVVRNLVKKVEKVAAQFGSIIESVGLPGWSGKGYRGADGNRYTGLAAFQAFVEDVQAGTIEIEPAF